LHSHLLQHVAIFEILERFEIRDGEVEILAETKKSGKLQGIKACGGRWRKDDPNLIKTGGALPLVGEITSATRVV
jgi:hypothetical protein